MISPSPVRPLANYPVTERRYRAPAQREHAVTSFRKQIAKCRKGAERCHFEAKRSPDAFEEEAWLDLADYWTELAEAFEEADQPTLH
jgi:hypothetical protein